MVNKGPQGSLSSLTVSAGDYVDDGGDILVGKLVGTALGSIWLTVVAGWLTVMEAVVALHVGLLNAAQGAYISVFRSYAEGGAGLFRASWAAAFRSAVEINPLLAPVILSAEIVVVSAVGLWAVRRWT